MCVCKQVFWVDEDQWFPGFIESYNSETNKHTIRYDDGEVEDIVLWGKKPEVHTFRFLEAYDNYNEGGENRGDSNEATENNRIENGNGLTHNLNPLWKTLSDLQANGTVTDNGGRDISLLTANTEKGKRPLQDGAFVPRNSKAVRPDEADKSLTVLPGLESVNRSFEEVADHLRAERDRLQNEVRVFPHASCVRSLTVDGRMEFPISRYVQKHIIPTVTRSRSRSRSQQRTD